MSGQRFTRSSNPPSISRHKPSEENASVLILASTWSVCSAVPMAASHSRIVMSSDAEASCLPSGEKATAWTESEWPSSTCNAPP